MSWIVAELDMCDLEAIGPWPVTRHRSKEEGNARRLGRSFGGMLFERSEQPPRYGWVMLACWNARHPLGCRCAAPPGEHLADADPWSFWSKPGTINHVNGGGGPL